MMDDPQSMINDERMFVTGQGRVTGVAELPTQRDNIVVACQIQPYTHGAHTHTARTSGCLVETGRST